jgi:hypothetical protein
MRRYLPTLIFWLLIIVLLGAVGNWMWLQIRYSDIDHDLLQTVTKSMSNIQENQTQNDSITSQLIFTSIDRIRSDFNFYLITSLITTIILGAGIALFLNAASTQKETQNTLLETSKKNTELKEELKNTRDRLRILDIEISTPPADLLYAIIRLEVFVANWERLKDNHGFIRQIKSGLERAYQLANPNQPLIGMYELKCMCEKFPEHPEINDIKKLAIEKLTEVMDGGKDV